LVKVRTKKQKEADKKEATKAQTKPKKSAPRTKSAQRAPGEVVALSLAARPSGAAHRRCSLVSHEEAAGERRGSGGGGWR
jgi:hypothetical protein